MNMFEKKIALNRIDRILNICINMYLLEHIYEIKS